MHKIKLKKVKHSGNIQYYKTQRSGLAFVISKVTIDNDKYYIWHILEYIFTRRPPIGAHFHNNEH